MVDRLVIVVNPFSVSVFSGVSVLFSYLAVSFLSCSSKSSTGLNPPFLNLSSVLLSFREFPYSSSRTSFRLLVSYPDLSLSFSFIRNVLPPFSRSFTFWSFLPIYRFKTVILVNAHRNNGLSLFYLLCTVQPYFGGQGPPI